MNAQQELERAGIFGATMVPGNSVTVIHQQQVSPALFNRIKNLEMANVGAKKRRVEQENKLSSQTSRIQSLESRLRNREQQLESQAIEIKTLQTEIADLRTSREADMVTIKRHDSLIKHHENFLKDEVLKHLNSFKEGLKSQMIKSNDQKRKFDETLALYQSMLMENQERGLCKELALHEATLLQKAKQMILTELLGLETRPGGDIGRKPDLQVVCSSNIDGFHGPSLSHKVHIQDRPDQTLIFGCLDRK
ncbi:hypothetical protein BOTCAL_0288g00040 [Botryotinia calthae]|uniref:Uncharacterized protein n=1 Tax=Botryotinia calthae TaxID=38488 RepID=A0A4Y8CX90_9HELO|nr:hypothetical protein BOTCAL_0288g00040 [Botryotinia calthae]